MEAFATKANQRDGHKWIVCGHASRLGLDHVHTIPKAEDDIWEDLRMRQFIPAEATSVEHGARNAILLCRIITHFLMDLLSTSMWIQDAPDGRQPHDDDEDAGDNNGNSKHNIKKPRAKENISRTNVIPASTSYTGSRQVVPGHTPMETLETLSANAGPCQAITSMNPFGNPTDLEAQTLLC
ncbi:hypothetical protein BS47DRAFT_1482897 [Hydnum rufescens UP504]|uniref:Uncharacterized protein n=1 Tax=Hydnum rufescens UP504 TaxID=1448309 RepID=A0A9P6E0D3_9AGAM|nr:hypothetical protein BS47DRAFT_1482897 [Hydnum rufescens UP504]